MVVMDMDRRPPSGGRRWQPLAGAALLDRLRVTGRRRPAADPDLAGRLVEGIEDRLVAAGPVPRGHRPVVVTADRLAEAVQGAPRRAAVAVEPTAARACGALVHVLFRQLVTTGSIGDPMVDGLAALSVDGHHGPLVGWIGQLPPADRAELEAEVDRQAAGMRERWPALDPAWLPRTRQAIRVPLADGAVELSARVDLVIGRPAVDEASIALVEVTSGRPRPEHRAELHFDALVETLRSGAPPFVVATYYTRTGELDVEPVGVALLEAAADRAAAGAAVLCRPPGGPVQADDLSAPEASAGLPVDRPGSDGGVQRSSAPGTAFDRGVTVGMAA